MKIRDKKARKSIEDTIRLTKEKIEVTGGECRYNFRCHLNTVHEALKHGHPRIAMTVYIEDDYPIVHFLNVDPETGEFIDNTLGEWARYNEYFLIKYIPEEEFTTVGTYLELYRKELRKGLSFWTRLLSEYGA